MVTTVNRKNVLIEELSRVDGVKPSSHQKLDKHNKMALNPFQFFRGSSQLFYRDILDGTLSFPEVFSKDVPLTMIMGDCHLSNFGLLTEEGSYNQNVIFSPNDFDDACFGRAIWDISRFIASLFLTQDYVCGIQKVNYQSNSNDKHKIISVPSLDETRSIAMQFLEEYKHTCLSIIDYPRMRLSAIDHVSPTHMLHDYFKKAIQRAPGGKKYLSKSTLAKSVDIELSPLKFKSLPRKFKTLENDRLLSIKQKFRPYVDDIILDVVQRLGAGTGSNNMERFYLLVGPAKILHKDDLSLCHVVEVKQQRAAAPIFYFPKLHPVNTLDPAHLTADCQRNMQRQADLILDDVVWEDKHWLVRSRHHARIGVDPENIAIASKDVKRQFAEYVRACGRSLALAHSRGDRRSTRFELSIVQSISRYSEDVLELSEQYSQQTIQDCALLRDILFL